MSIKIFIIDDDESFCDVMKFHFEEVGFKYSTRWENGPVFIYV